MFEHDENFEETVRSIAQELGRSVERALERADLEGIADTVGVDPSRAREWADSAGEWLRAQAENLGEEVAHKTTRPARREPAPAPTPPADPLSTAGPSPLDMPSDEQGLALSALDSGRWTVEPGSHMLASQGDGPGPNDALGLVRELRARDWIAADGRLTLAGSHALRRWLDAADSRR